MKTILLFAQEHGLTMTCGSDIHDLKWTEEGRIFAMETDEPLNREQDYVRLIKSGSGYRLRYPAERMNCTAVYPVLPAYLHKKDGTVIQF